MTHLLTQFQLFNINTTMENKIQNIQPVPKEHQNSEHQTDSSYIDSDAQPQLQSYQPPKQQQISKALFQRYKEQTQNIITQQDENQSCLETKTDKANNGQKQNRTVLRIKNLDTGQYQEFQTEEQGQAFNREISKDVQKLKKIHSAGSWGGFWKKVAKNSEKLQYYAESGMYDEVITMLTKGEDGYPAEINYKGLDDWTALHYASYQGHDDIVELLLQHSSDINALTKFQRNSLHIATIRGHLTVIKKLCKNNIDVNACDMDGNTALHFAAQNSYKDIVQYLLSIYCTIKKNKQGYTPIDDCCEDSVKKIFTQYGFKENEDYQSYSKQKKTSKLQKAIISSPNNITPDDFDYYKLLGKGSFGEVFLVRKKNDETKKLCAMKVLSKEKVFSKNLKRYALTERNVMSVINHPFMVKLNYAFQSPTKLFLIMDYYPGGDLGKLISKKKTLSEEEARKYICELVLAFEALHKNMIVFRDLKPDNVVLDSEGHCRLTDFGLSKEGIYNNTTESFCGSVAYLAPEILAKQGHSRTVDWYLIGLLLYELIVGLPPYYNSKKEVLFENIKRGPLKIPKSMSSQAKDLIKKLLCRDPRKRLGSMRDSEQLKEHPFFKGVNWLQVFNRKISMPPIQQPNINLSETIKISFNQPGENNKKIEGWTFIGHQ